MFGDAFDLASFLGDAFGCGDACGGTSVDDEACVFGGLPRLPFGSCCPSGEVSSGLVVLAFAFAGFGFAPSSLLFSPRGAIKSSIASLWKASNMFLPIIILCSLSSSCLCWCISSSSIAIAWASSIYGSTSWARIFFRPCLFDLDLGVPI